MLANFTFFHFPISLKTPSPHTHTKPTLSNSKMYKFNHFHLTLFTSFFLCLTLNLNLSNAQSPMGPVPTYINHHSWEPSVAITVGAVIFALIVMAVISLYLRRCTDSHIIITTTTTSRVPCSCSHGITMELLNTFPTLFYSNIKHLSKDNQTLECAVCLTDFTDNDALRLLPKCNHVFHPHCIDSWLASHVTCPVCRANLSHDSSQVSITLQPDNNQEVSTTTQQTPTQIEPITNTDTNTNTNTNHCGSQVCVENPTFIGDNTTKSVCVTEEQQISSEIASVVELSSDTNSDSITGNGGDDGVGVVALETSLSRSNSTGHSLVEQGKGVERYTLRLPEDVRRYIFVNHGRTVERSSSVKEVCWSDSEESYTGKRVSGEVRVEKRWVICTPPFVARHG